MDPHDMCQRDFARTNQPTRQGRAIDPEGVHVRRESRRLQHDDEAREMPSNLERLSRFSAQRNERRAMGELGLYSAQPTKHANARHANRLEIDDLCNTNNSSREAKRMLYNNDLSMISQPNATACQSPKDLCSLMIPTRGTSVATCVSELTHPQIDNPAKVVPEVKQAPATRRKASMITWKESTTNPNQPHPALECPALYFLLRGSPSLLEMSKRFFRFRWRLSYPMQTHVPLKCTTFPKLNVFLTLGELLLIFPFLVALITCTVYAFACPSVSISGHTARTPLIFAFITATRNSPLTLLLGIPVDRAIWYHKLCARLAYINGLMHTIVSFVYPKATGEEHLPPSTSSIGTDPNFGRFLFADKVNSGGTMILVFMTLMIITALPFVRRRVFEVFYYLHIIFATSMVVCAFFHTGIVVPILVSLTWGVDLVIRKGYMPFLRYPKKASVRIISESVIELCFPKADGFDYNPGQYVYIAIPEISLFQWHPFSLSSSPEQKIVTLHIRKAGNWTSALFDLAMKKMDVSILLEGPYGSVGVDLDSDRYKMVMLLSGGIGVTPMQSLCNQLMYEQSVGRRELKKLSFVWIERDPNSISKIDVVRHNTGKVVASAELDEEQVVHGLQGLTRESSSRSVATILLTLIPKSVVVDEDIEEDYSTSRSDFNSNADHVRGFNDAGHKTTMDLRNEYRMQTIPSSRTVQLCDADQDTICQSLLDVAYCGGRDCEDRSSEVMDLQVFLTTKTPISDVMIGMPFVTYGRPDLPKMFERMKLAAIADNESRVAVCICAPEALVLIVKKACRDFSDHDVQFDLHHELFG